MTVLTEPWDLPQGAPRAGGTQLGEPQGAALGAGSHQPPQTLRPPAVGHSRGQVPNPSSTGVQSLVPLLPLLGVLGDEAELFYIWPRHVNISQTLGNRVFLHPVLLLHRNGKKT